jgi:hypothetical protein
LIIAASGPFGFERPDLPDLYRRTSSGSRDEKKKRSGYGSIWGDGG